MPVIVPENQYSVQLNQVLNFAHVNCHRDIRLDSLADVACLSKYHFLHIFHDQVRESPAAFLRRIRLERAACMLTINRKRSILDVGLLCGFSSAQQFSRVFAKKFDRCPREYRKEQSTMRYTRDSREFESSRQRFQTIAAGIHPHISAKKPVIVARPPVKVVYVRNIGSYGNSSGIGKAADAMVHWARSKQLWTAKSYIIGVSWDYSSITPPTLCRYDICLEIPEHFNDTKGMSMQLLPGGSFAVMRVSIHQAEDVIAAWQYFYNTLKHSPEFLPYRVEDDFGPWYEIFYNNEGAGYTVDMHVHLRPR